MTKKWRTVKEFVMKDGWKKLVRPTVALHKTAFPKTSKDNEKLGVRFDFAGTIEESGNMFHRFQVQVCAGNKIPTSWKEWRQRHEKSTHGIVATIQIPDQGDKDDVEKAFDAVEDSID